MIKKIKIFFEKIGFNVIDRLSKKAGLSTSKVRTYFVYSCFIFLAMPYFIYLFLAFLLRIKDLFFFKRKSVFDL